MAYFNVDKKIDTWNGVATAHIKASDSDLSIDLIGGSHVLSVAEDGSVDILGRATDGMLFLRGKMTFPSEEVRHNYLVDFSA